MKPTIKYVKKANMWCVSSWKKLDDKKIKQEQKWFSTQEEALAYLDEIIKTI